MHKYILVIAIFIHSYSMGMEKSDRSDHHITHLGTAVWRPSSHEIIYQQSVPQAELQYEIQGSKKVAVSPQYRTYIYHVLTRQERILEASNDIPLLTACSSNGTHFAALSSIPAQIINGELVQNSANKVKIWNLETGVQTAECQTVQSSFLLSAQGKYVACDSKDSSTFDVRLLENGALIYSFFKKTHKGHPERLPHSQYDPTHASSIAYSPHDKHIAFEEAGMIKIGYLNCCATKLHVIQGYSPRFTSQKLIVREGATFNFYDVGSFDKIGSFILLPHIKNFQNVYFNSNYTSVIVPTKYGYGKELLSLKDQKGEQYEEILAYSPDFSKLAYMHFNNSVIKDFQPVTGNGPIITYLKGMPSHPTHCYFSPNAEYLILESPTFVYVINQHKGVCQIAATRVLPTTCCPNSRYLLLRRNSYRSQIIDLQSLQYDPSKL